MSEQLELDPETDYRKAQLRWRARREQDAKTEGWDETPFGRIDSDPLILSGKPLLTGTRISVEIVMRMLAGGRSNAEIFIDYAHLFPEDLDACIRYAATGAKLSPRQDRKEEDCEPDLTEVAAELLKKRGLNSALDGD